MAPLKNIVVYIRIIENLLVEQHDNNTVELELMHSNTGIKNSPYTKVCSTMMQLRPAIRGLWHLAILLTVFRISSSATQDKWPSELFAILINQGMLDPTLQTHTIPELELPGVQDALAAADNLLHQGAGDPQGAAAALRTLVHAVRYVERLWIQTHQDTGITKKTPATGIFNQHSARIQSPDVLPMLCCWPRDLSWHSGFPPMTLPLPTTACAVISCVL